MHQSRLFDEWAGSYDSSIKRDVKGYPFEGYYNVLAYVHGCIKKGKNIKMLDLGVGTGLLTQELYKQGCTVYGIDFSVRMLDQAKEKMSQGNFFCYDLKAGIPEELTTIKFNYIVSSYALHHLDDDVKIKLLLNLRDNNLEPGGIMVIADIGFPTQADLERCRKEADQMWDDEEYYIVGERFLELFTQKNIKATYTQISPCAGVLEVY